MNDLVVVDYCYNDKDSYCTRVNGNVDLIMYTKRAGVLDFVGKNPASKSSFCLGGIEFLSKSKHNAASYSGAKC